eukprot:355066-Chlamydomonas_euryale.AAC.11
MPGFVSLCPCVAQIMADNFIALGEGFNKGCRLEVSPAAHHTVHGQHLLATPTSVSRPCRHAVLRTCVAQRCHSRRQC